MVVNAWVEEGYSLRRAIGDALLSFSNNDASQSELNEVIEQLQDLILTLDRPPVSKSADTLLSNSILDAVKQSAKSGVNI